MKKGTQKNSEINNLFNGRDAHIVWQELLQNSKPISREEIIKRLGGTPPGYWLLEFPVHNR